MPRFDHPKGAPNRSPLRNVLRLISRPYDATKAARELSRAAFNRLAPPRVDAALKKISLIGNLARHGYEYETSEVKQMIDALEDAVAQVKQKFARKKEPNKVGFAFITTKRSAA